MREIAKNAAKAFAANKLFRCQNTEVRDEAIYLHGHKIVWRENSHICFSLCGWNTVTTRSRINDVLRYLGHDVQVWQRDFTPYVTLDGYTTALDDYGTIVL